MYCKCPEQWKAISRYSPKRLSEFINEREFDNQQQLYETIFSFAHRLFAMTMDKMSLGNGHVQTELESDVSLRQAIEQEGSILVQFLTNKWKIAALTSVDVFNGKRQQMLSEPIDEPVIEEISADDGKEGSAYSGEEGQQGSSGEVVFSTPTEEEGTEA